jgi:hypothetical protein
VSIKAHEGRCTREKGFGLTHSETERDYGRFQGHAIDIFLDGWGCNCCTDSIEGSWKTGMTNVNRMGDCVLFFPLRRGNWKLNMRLGNMQAQLIFTSFPKKTWDTPNFLIS